MNVRFQWHAIEEQQQLRRKSLFVIVKFIPPTIIFPPATILFRSAFKRTNTNVVCRSIGIISIYACHKTMTRKISIQPTRKNKPRTPKLIHPCINFTNNLIRNLCPLDIIWNEYHLPQQKQTTMKNTHS